MTGRWKGYTYKRNRLVGAHCIENMRQRAGSPRIANMESADLGNWIDESVVLALGEGHEEQIHDDGVDCRLVAIGNLDRCPDHLFALIKPTRGKHPKGYTESVVTVLTNGMVHRLKRDRWEEKSINTPFAALADIKLEEFTDASVRDVVTSAAQPCEPAPSSESVSAGALAVGAGSYLITYNGLGGYRTMIVSETNVRDTLAQLEQDEHASRIRLWKELEFTAQVRVEVNIAV